NLAGVYCDAVFYPRISLDHFRQEGHHLAFADPPDPSGRLIVRGIVYNEMKGVYSDLDGIIDREMMKRLFPANAYGRDYGGDPEAIRSLTYERFREYHRTRYHPANSLVFLYGSIATSRHLAFLDREYLSGFDRAAVDTAIAPQPAWRKPRLVRRPYPIGPAESPEGKTAVVAAFRTGKNIRPVDTLSLHVLSQYLLGHAASPLRKALIDSRLGEELSDSGYSSVQRDTCFAVGLKGSEEDRAGKILDLIIETCAREASRGLDRERLQSAFHAFELSAREIKSHYPLRLMDRAFESWAASGDPLVWMRINRQIREVRRRWESEEGYFEDRLRQLIVENPSRVLLVFPPDPGLSGRRERSERRRMKNLKASLSAGERERIAREARELELSQSAPNTPEALSSLPRLSPSDVPAEPFLLPTVLEEVSGRPLLATDLFSNGITYLALAFDLRGLAGEDYPYLSLFTDALCEMGAAGYDFAAMADREAACSGGVDSDLSISGTIAEPRAVRPCLTVFCRALDRKLPEMLSLLSDRLTQCDLSDRGRLRDVLLQGRVSRKSRVIPAGNSFAASYAARGLSRNCALNESLKGLTQVRLFDRLPADFACSPEEVEGRLTSIRDFLQSGNRITISVVGSEEARSAVRGWYGSLLAGMRDDPVIAGEEPGFTPVSPREGIAVPAEVGFVARVLPAVPFTDPAAPALLLLSQNLSYGYLWEKVRVLGGAYGCSAHYDAARGVFAFSSYRDPNIVETLRVYDGVGDYIEKEMDLSRDGVEQAIIGAVKTLDRPIRPGQAVELALSRHLRETTPARLQKFRRRLLNLTGEEIRRAAEEIIRPRLLTSPSCVIAGREKLETAAKKLGEEFPITDL
ncbi:MAG: insulinase family protein, partial [Candidatus Erginobacter occultus]|nr:insulinase family protein [Candidatus Erginobacter occultus]